METFLHVGAGARGRDGIDFDELGVGEVVQLLDDANMEAVVRDFGDRNPQEDPVIHFYELFLREYDKKQKVSRGVFYTPRPVVSCIVRSLDELLRNEFGLEDGLADITSWAGMAERHPGIEIPKGTSPDQAFVQILDPATGTGTFLVEVIDLIHKTLITKWNAESHGQTEVDALWNEYVPKHLLPRLHGYELLMAPYAIAHLKIGLKLHETGYRFGSGERARVYLTNALEPAHDYSGQFAFAIPALAHEAHAVNAIKRQQRFTVMIGNPPYSGLSANMTEAAAQLIEPYKFIDGVHFAERKHWLHDDYVKFVRLSESALRASGVGALGLITHHAFYDNPTFRGMRWSLLQSFDHLFLLDLHGNPMKREHNPSGGDDKNVFDIQQGVAISVSIKKPRDTENVVMHSDLWGSRDFKYKLLSQQSVGDLCINHLSPRPKFYFFVPRDEENSEEYEKWMPLNEVFPICAGGFITARDHFVVDFDRENLLSRIEAMRDESVTDAEFRSRFFAGAGSDKYPDGDTRGWKLPQARHTARQDPEWRSHAIKCLYRPFDVRWIYWTDWMVDWPRPEVNGHLLHSGNVGLVFMRQVASGDAYSQFLVSRMPVDARACYSNKGIMTLAPLYLHDEGNQRGGNMRLQSDESSANISPVFWRALVSNLGSDASETMLTPENVFSFAYAVLHSPTYRSRYVEFLKVDFPRLPFAGSRDLFSALADHGRILIDLHLMESQALDSPITTYLGPPNPEVGRVGWSHNSVWLDAAAPKRASPAAAGTMGFGGVPEDVWSFHIGGYQVCHKWLKDRKGRTLSDSDIAHYKKIVVAISETIRLMTEIDEVIDAHGGWPEAFAAGVAG